jgi:hypothetical protein
MRKRFGCLLKGNSFGIQDVLSVNVPNYPRATSGLQLRLSITRGLHVACTWLSKPEPSAIPKLLHNTSCTTGTPTHAMIRHASDRAIPRLIWRPSWLGTTMRHCGVGEVSEADSHPDLRAYDGSRSRTLGYRERIQTNPGAVRKSFPRFGSCICLQ